MKSPLATDGGRPRQDPRQDRGFSLVEVVLALGVVAFAIVAIIGMLPVAMSSALESKRESRAAFIANHLAATLRATPFQNARPIESMTSGINLAVSSNTTIAFDDNGAPIGVIPDTQYQSGVPLSGSTASASFLARVSAAPASGLAGLASVSIEVSTPAAAPRSSRQAFSFVTLIANTETAPAPPSP